MTKDMTVGKITPQLIDFTIPLVIGNLLQLTYNAADSAIVGRFVGPQALAALGISAPIVTTCILFITGLCMGASVIMSTMFGAGDYNGLKKEISTTMMTGSIFAILVSLISFLVTPHIFSLLNTPMDVRPYGITYLRIYFCGLIFTFIYNCYAMTLRALGDSKSPLLFLGLSALLNIGGDLFFVIILGMQVEGCAIATVLSEALCCILCTVYVRKKIDLMRLGKKWFYIDRELLGKTISYGWATAIQQAIVPFGKILCQSMINTLGTSAVAAVAATSRIDDIALVPMQNIAFATTAFMAQNLGAKKKDRMKQGFKEGMIIAETYAVIVVLVCFFAARIIMQLFTADSDVINIGIRYLHIMALLYVMPAATNGIQGYFRSFGRMRTTLIATLGNIGGRVIALAVLMFGFGLDIVAVPISCGIGWLVMMVYEVPLLLLSYKKDLQ